MRELESSFDENTSAMDRNRKKSKLLNEQIKSQEKLVEELEKGLSEAEKAYGDNATETNKWKQAVNNAKTDLNKMRAELKKVPSDMTAVGQEMQKVGKGMQDIGSSLTKYVTVPLTALATASVAAWKEVDEGLDIVTKKTGATGAELEALQESALKIANTIPTSFETAGEAIGEVNTRFGLTGTALEDLSTKFIKFADLNDTDVVSSIDSVQKAMEAYGLETEEAGQFLDVLNKTGQDTGISMETLLSSMTKNAASLKDMGLNAYDAAQFLGKVETSGADVSVVMTGLKKAFTNAAKAGKSLPDALKDFQKTMSSSASEQDKLTAAVELFGKNAGPAIYEACKTGSLSFESLSADASTYLGNVETTFNNVKDPADDFKVAMNNVKTAGYKLGKNLAKYALPAIEKISAAAEAAGDWFDGLTESQQKLVSYASFFAAGLGPVMSILGTLTEAAGGVVSALGSISGLSGFGSILSVAGPIGAAAGAFALLAAGIHEAHENALDGVEGLREMLKNTASSTEELNDAVDKVKSTINDTNETVDDINTKAAVADKLIEELYKLEGASDKTAEQQARMKAIVGELNSLYPGLSLAIDETTGSLNKGKSEVSAYVEETKKIALAEAYATGIKNAYADLAEAEMKLNKANQQKQELEAANYEAYHAYYEYLQKVPKYYDENGNAIVIYDEKLQQLEDTYNITKEALSKQNETIRQNEKAVKESEATVGEWQDAYDDITDSSKDATKATEDQTEATENATYAIDDYADASEDAAKETTNLEKKQNKLASTLISTAQMVGKAKNALKEAGKAAKAAGDDYRQSEQQAKASLQSQIGLFDAYEKRAEVNIQTLIANAHSREQAYADYAENLQKLTERAEQSGSETLKAYAQHVTEMGMAGAEELAVLVNATDEQLQELADADYRAELHMDFASEETAYVLNGFMTEEQKEFATFGNTLSTNLSNAIGNSKIWTNFKTNSKNALDGQKTYWKNNSPETKVKVNVPDSKTLFGKKTAIQKGIGTPNTSVSVSTPDKNSLLTKKQAIAKAFTGLSATVSIKTSGASDAGRAAARSIKNAAGTVYIPVAATRTSSAARPYATGGFVDEPTYSLVGEAGPEVIIPLSSNMRARALDLFQQAGESLGVQTITAPTPSAPTTRIPDRSSPSSGSSALNIDFSQLYDAVASAARAGMQSANIKVYWNNREAGRIMKNMGVQFA